MTTSAEKNIPPSEDAGAGNDAAKPLPGWMGAATLALAAAATIAICAIVGSQVLQIGIPGEWQWQYYENSPALAPMIQGGLLLVLLALLTAFILSRGLQSIRQEVVTLCVAMLLALAAILMLGNASPEGKYSALNSIVAPWAGGYYAEAAHVDDMRKYLAEYDKTIADLKVNDVIRGHIADHPAGPVVFHWMINAAMDRAPFLARMFTPPDADMSIGDDLTPRKLAEMSARTTLSNGRFAGIFASALAYRLGMWLALLFVYLLARDLYNREAALAAFALAALIPSLHIFGPYPDQLFPLFMLAAVYAWNRALKTKNAGWAAASGVITVIGLLWTMALLAIGLVLAGWTILSAAAVQRESRKSFLRALVVLFISWLLGAVTISLLPTFVFGYDTWRVWRICLEQHASFASLFPRSYWAWTGFNVVEFALFIGIPTAALLVAAVCASLFGRNPGLCGTTALWTLIATVAVLDLSGKNLGETARLWMFLMPLGAVAAGPMLAGLDRRRGWYAAALILLGAAQLLVFRWNLDVFRIL